MKKLLLMFLIFSFTFLFFACEEPIEIKYEITGLNTVEEGCSIKLETNLTGDVTWSSSNDSLATVVDGMVIAHNKGEVVITAKADDIILEHQITITPRIIEITIIGPNNIFIGETALFTYSLSKETDEKVKWSSSDSKIIEIDENGLAKALKIGSAKIIAKIDDNISEYEVTVSKYEFTLSFTAGQNKVQIGTSFNLVAKTDPELTNVEILYKSSNPDIATVDEFGNVTGVSEGRTSIKAYYAYDSNISTSIIVNVVNYAPLNIKISGDNEVVAGSFGFLETTITGDGTHEVSWSSTDETVAICSNGIILGLQPGTVTIYAKSVVDKDVYGSIKVEVKKHNSIEDSEEDLERVNNILNQMTLSQKVGQMFVMGFNSITMPSALSKAIEDYNLGNVIYMAYNVNNPNAITTLSNDIQTKMVAENLVPAFITIDQEGGRVARLTNGGTHFISQMAMAATNNYNNTYLETKAIGNELRSYGINANFSPVLDVNNNPNNPIIGIRSYADDPIIVSLFGDQAIKGFQESNVMGTAKHFPGHGNTAVDSHYGLPIITTAMKDLYSTELAPFISSITSGIDAIMTTHIMFKAIDEEYPATLSKKVLTDLLRDKLGYNGLIITDGMEMDAIDKFFGDYDETAVMAVKAGVDILTYTTISSPITAHQGIVKAVESGELTEERINESVRRILLKKLKYGILDSYLTEEVKRDKMLEEHENLNIQFAMDSLTKVKGEFNGLDKNKSTLIISPTTNFSLGSGLQSNSFANYAANYLKSQGHMNVSYKQVSANITNNESSAILDSINSYDQIVVALSNVKTSNYGRSATFVKNLISKHQNVVVIALDTPYDILAYNENVKNYICVYGYQKATVIALSKYLNGEFEAKGVLPIDGRNF